ncbi:hypothetical protein [uncultured Parvibaculum sp.]|uniref:hypothetical protein n=1 Tax=uncultured Parvibaculum sp. TaxID=291828 RepID=UPI0030DCFC2E|tara:strand:- start:19905 stop:20156 length:252 start_codon:yes stop_codon:yes gene_type:complete
MPNRKNESGKVTEALKESFPASDAPALNSDKATPESDAKRAERKAENAADEEKIDEALDESFPASDPPAWTGTHAGDGHNPRK